MRRYLAPLALAALMMAVAALSILDIVPEQAAQFAPMALLAMFPRVWLGSGRRCLRAR